MPTYNSPGVYTLEKDFSNFDPASSPTTPGIVGFASQGPVDKPILISSTVDLERIFGLPSETVGGQGLLGAYEIMKETNQLMFVRAQTTAAARAGANLSFGTLPHVTLQASSSYDEGITRNIFNPAMTGSTPSGSAHFLVQVKNSAGTTMNEKPYFLSVAQPSDIDVVVSAFQKTLSDQSDFSVHKISSKKICFVGMYPGKDAEITVSALAPSATTCADFQSTTLSGHGAIGGGGRLLSKTDTGTYVQFDGTLVGLAHLDDNAAFASQLVSNTGKDVTGMTLASGMFYEGSGFYHASGVDSMTSSTYLASNGQLSSTGSTANDSNVLGGTYALNALHNGAGYNAASSYNGISTAQRGLKVRVENTGKFQQSVSVLRNGALEETYKVEFYKDTTNSGIPTWPEEVINTKTYGNGEKSDNVYGRFEKDAANPVLWTPPTAQGLATLMKVTTSTDSSSDFSASGGYVRFLKFLEGTTDFAGGANGDAGDHGNSLSNTEVVNALAGPAGTTRGVKAFSPDTVEVDLVAIPGVHTQDVQTAAIEAAEGKGAFLYVTSPPEGLTPQEAVDWHNGNYPGRTVSINSSYAALYYPHCKMMNQWTGVDQYVDPAIVGIKAMSRADNIADVWVAPAGITRGKVSPAVKELERDLNQGDRDYIYGGGNALNPIVNFNRQGICIWGQRTSQRVATALDRINVRRLAIAIRQKVRDLGLPFVFEPNDPITWGLITGAVEPMLEDIQSRRGIRAFKVFCDETTNTPQRIERNELWVKVEVTPTKSAESLIFEINVLGQQEA